MIGVIEPQIFDVLVKGNAQFCDKKAAEVFWGVIQRGCSICHGDGLAEMLLKVQQDPSNFVFVRFYLIQ